MVIVSRSTELKCDVTFFKHYAVIISERATRNPLFRKKVLVVLILIKYKKVKTN